MEEINALTHEIIASAMAVHRSLGPGLLESAYEACMEYEFRTRKLKYERQKPLPIVYNSTVLDCGYRLDFIVNSMVIVELKSVEQIDRIHEAQVLSYLKLSALPVGLLINFNVTLLKKGVKRFVSKNFNQKAAIVNGP